MDPHARPIVHRLAGRTAPSLGPAPCGEVGQARRARVLVLRMTQAA